MTDTAVQRLDDATIERARAARSLVALVARRVQLRRAGRSWSGLCPFHREKTPSFTVTDEKGFYHCFGCGAHGSAIDWMMEAEGLSFREAVASLLGGALPDARRPMQAVERESAPRSVDVVSSATAGRWIWQTAFPARGEIVERYLASRGLDALVDLAPGAPPHTGQVQNLGPGAPGAWCPIDQVRFHPRCPLGTWRVHEEPQSIGRTAPAMVVPIADAEGAIWGVRVTWIRPDGSGEAVLPRRGDGSERPKRKVFGRLNGFAAFLTSPDLTSGTSPTANLSVPLVVGEGFETTWAFAQQLGRPCRAIATLSLENLQGQPVRLRDGSLPLWKVEADPERSPFTLPDAGEVLIAVDADMKPLKDQKVQLVRGAKTVRSDLTGLQRAEICATLAAQAWRRASATSVRCVRPRMGMDFNDQIRSAA